MPRSIKITLVYLAIILLMPVIWLISMILSTITATKVVLKESPPQLFNLLMGYDND